MLSIYAKSTQKDWKERNTNAFSGHIGQWTKNHFFLFSVT